MSTATLVARGLLVLVVLAVALWCVRRTDGLRVVRREGALQVLGSARVGKGATVTLVRIGDAEYALGVTDSAVSLLTRTGDAGGPVEASEPQPAPAALPAPRPSSLAATRRRSPASSAAPAAAVPGRRKASAVAPSALGTRLGLALRARLVRTEEPVVVPDFAAELAAALPRPRAAEPRTALPAPRAAVEDPRTELLDDVLLAVLAERPAARLEIVAGLQVAAPAAEDLSETPAVAVAATAPPLASRTPRVHTVTDGSVTPSRRAGTYAVARSAARMDAPARQDEEHPWSTSCRQRRVRAQRALLDREACLR